MNALKILVGTAVFPGCSQSKSRPQRAQFRIVKFFLLLFSTAASARERHPRRGVWPHISFLLFGAKRHGEGKLAKHETCKAAVPLFKSPLHQRWNTSLHPRAGFFTFFFCHTWTLAPGMFHLRWKLEQKDGFFCPPPPHKQTLLLANRTPTTQVPSMVEQLFRFTSTWSLWSWANRMQILQNFPSSLRAVYGECGFQHANATAVFF